ncbi:MAG: hypothetical protein ACI9WU_003691, partial [Myxococcota bacterium]
HGCCINVNGTNTAALGISPNCSFLGLGDESGTVEIRVKPNPGTGCANYLFQWGET